MEIDKAMEILGLRAALSLAEQGLRGVVKDADSLDLAQTFAASAQAKVNGIRREFGGTPSSESWSPDPRLLSYPHTAEHAHVTDTA